MGSTSASRALSSSGCFSVSGLRPPPGRRTRPNSLGAVSPLSSRSPRPMVEHATPVISETSLIPPCPKLPASAAASNRPAPLVKIRSQSLVSIFDTIRVVHSLYIEDIPILRNPPSNHPPDHSVISTKLAGIIPSSAQAPGARGGLGTPGRRGRTGGLRQDRSNFHVHPHKEKGGIVPVRPFFRPLPTAPNTAPGRPFDCRFRRNATVAHASAVVTPQAGRTDSECHPCKELRPPGSRETLNQEFDNIRFDSSWTGPKEEKKSASTLPALRSTPIDNVEVNKRTATSDANLS